MKKRYITEETLEKVKRSCLDHLAYMQLKRNKRILLSYSDYQLEMNAIQTLYMLEKLEKEDIVIKED